MSVLTKSDIRRLFELLGRELAAREVAGELYLVGGAEMCLALDAREATRNVDAFLELPHLKVFVAHPRYLLAMKCAAMRLGEEFHDLDDVRYLLRHLNISTVDEAFAVVTRYFDEKQLLPKTRLMLEELLENGRNRL